MNAHTPIPENALDALKFSELDEAEQQSLLLELHELIYKGSFVRLLERMDEKTRDEFTALLEADASEDEVQAFIESHVPNAQSAVTEAVDELTNDILSLTRE